MATTQITVTAFQTACAECADAIDGADFATAIKKYAVAEAINGGLDLEAEHSGTRYQRRDNLAGLKAAIDAAEVAAGKASGQGRLVTARTRFNQ